ncbi:MAG: hypothetical protein ACRDJ4_03220 [Actinomycetota bacterium]
MRGGSALCSEPARPRHLRREVVSWLWLVILAAIPPVALLPGGPACAQEGHRAAVVVRGDKEERTFCVAAEENGQPGTSGLAGLKASGLPVVTKDFGGSLGEAVCAIEGLGDCEFKTGYWAYFKGTAPGTWEMSSTGPSGSRLESGGVDGWVWVPAPGTDAASPPTAKPVFSELCKAASASPAATPAGVAGRGGGRPWLVLGGVGIVVLAVAAVVAGRRGRRAEGDEEP